MFIFWHFEQGEKHAFFEHCGTHLKELPVRSGFRKQNYLDLWSYFGRFDLGTCIECFVWLNLQVLLTFDYLSNTFRAHGNYKMVWWVTVLFLFWGWEELHWCYGATWHTKYIHLIGCRSLRVPFKFFLSLTLWDHLRLWSSTCMSWFWACWNIALYMFSKYPL